MIRLIVDSTCDMPKELIGKYHIEVLPLFVTIGEDTYRDGPEIDLKRLYDTMRQGIVPKTSQISAEDTETVFRRICEAGDDFIFLSFSSEMSGTYQLAQIIVSDLREEFPSCRMEVVDSEGGCFATGLIAMQCARWIASGRDYEDVLSHVKDMIGKIQHLFTLDSLNWLAKGGRIAKPAGYVGDVLQIKPILHVTDKTMHVVRVVRGRKNTLKTLVEMLRERMKECPRQLIGITHADDPEAAAQVEQMIHEALPEAKTKVLPIGCVLGTHLGIGGVGLFFVKAPVADYDLLSEPL